MRGEVTRLWGLLLRFDFLRSFIESRLLLLTFMLRRYATLQMQAGFIGPLARSTPSLPLAGHREAVIELRFVPQDCDAADGALPTALQTRRMCRWDRASGARPRYQRGGRQS